MQKVGLLHILVRSDGHYWTGKGWSADVNVAERMSKKAAERAVAGYRKVVVREEPGALKHLIARLKPALRQAAEKDPAVLRLYGIITD